MPCLFNKISYIGLLALLHLTLIFNASAIEHRIISLAPHTTEIAFALGVGDQVVAVSDYSDYPEQARRLPRVASHQGLDFEAILHLEATIILAWQGGNRPQDLARLASLNQSLYYSVPKKPEDVAADLRNIGDLVGKAEKGRALAAEYLLALQGIKSRFRKTQLKPVFYYMWPSPLMTIGKNAWASNLLNICGARSIFSDAMVDYPEVAIEQVIKRKPILAIAAMNISQKEAESFWSPYKMLTKQPVIVVNPDKLHRFTQRLIPELSALCEQIHK